MINHESGSDLAPYAYVHGAENFAWYKQSSSSVVQTYTSHEPRE